MEQPVVLHRRWVCFNGKPRLSRSEDTMAKISIAHSLRSTKHDLRISRRWINAPKYVYPIRCVTPIQKTKSSSTLGNWDTSVSEI